MYNTIQFSADSRWVLIKEEQYSYETNTANSFIHDLENRKSYKLPYIVMSFAFTQDQEHVILAGADYQTPMAFPGCKTPKSGNCPQSSANSFKNRRNRRKRSACDQPERSLAAFGAQPFQP